MTNEQLRMQFIGGIITESEYKQKLSEQTDTDFIKSEMERLTNKINTNPDIIDQEKKRRIDNIKFVIYDYLDPNTKGGKRPSSDFQFNTNWWNSIPADINKWIVEDALLDLLRAAKGDSFGENDIPLKENKSPKSKKSLNENIVSIGAINNPFPKHKKSLKEWGGGMPEDPNSYFGKMNAKRRDQNAEWERRNKLPVSFRETLEAGDIVDYDGKKWMIMYIYDDGDVDLKMQQPFRDEMGITKVGDPRAYAEKVPRSEIK
jgi:hypothetical protein